MLRDDRLLGPTRWVSIGIVPVLGAAFVILYLFPGSTMRLWSWMVCPHMSAYIIGGGYLAGAWLFARAARSRAWHSVSVGFVATTVFSTILLGVTILQWDTFNHNHVSFWAWLLLYLVTPVLLPVLWSKNRRTDPRTLAAGDVAVPRALRILVGTGGALQLAFAAAMLLRPDAMLDELPFVTDATTLRALAAFVAFPAVSWFCFLVERRWSCFRITQQTATIGMVLILVGTLLSRVEFRSDAWFVAYVAGLVAAIASSVALYVAMERRARRDARGVDEALARAQVPELIASF